jgi:oligopeptide/dipeptide ABC transporter ATP-binding protein
MYLGRVVEFSRCDKIFHKPMHPYTENLMKSIPKVGKKARTRLEAIKGTVPIPLNLPRECGFYPRCQKAMEGVCNKGVPALKEVEEGHFVRCYLYHKENEEE